MIASTRTQRLRDRPTLVPLSPLPPRLSDSSGGEGQQRNCQRGNQCGMPRLVRELSGREHQTCRDQCPGRSSRRRGRPQLPHDQPKQRAQPDDPNHHGSGLRCPLEAGKQHARARERQHRQQHRLRLPRQLFLSHASSYSGSPAALRRRRNSQVAFSSTGVAQRGGRLREGLPPAGLR